MIHHGDCLDVMAGLEAESVDAIVTDPPYLLQFMGKTWDSPTKLSGHATPDAGTVGFYQAVGKGGRHDGGMDNWRPNLMGQWHQAWAEAAYRVAKPSAYLLAFGGTRTVHRMTVALEDAGWIIRDMLVWAYASGFPKSKASLKPAWEPIVMARKPGPLRELAIDACRIPMSASDADVIRTAGGFMQAGWQGPNTGIYNKSGDITVGATVAAGRWPANILLTDPIFDGGVEGVVGGGEARTSGLYEKEGAPAGMFGLTSDLSTQYQDSGTYSRFFQIPRGASCDWCGVSIAAPSSFPPSQPAASAPNPVATVGSSGSAITMDSLITSGIVTPSSRDADVNTPRTPRSRPHGTSPGSAPPSSPAKSPDAGSPETGITTITAGLSMCATCAEAITSATTSRSPEERNYPWAFLVPKADRSDREPVWGHDLTPGHVDFGGNGKVGAGFNEVVHGKAPRQRANVHPTVKPIDLMRHLVRLVTPSGGTVLDPFLGSGTTAVAAVMEGFDWIGIEKEAEYVAICEARLNGVQQGFGLSA